MRKKSLIPLFFVLLFKFSYSQLINKPVDIKSPNVSSLGRYGDTPVSHYNGTIDVNIPLYSITESGIPLDLSLSYDSSGILVNSVASWVGQNWSLNAGGVITRSIKGKSDVRHIEFNFEGNIQKRRGFKYVGHRLSTPNWSTSNNLNSLIQESQIWNVSNSYRDMDLEPDIFTFNFMGINGRFFLGNDGEWKVDSDANLKIKTYLRLPPDLRESPNSLGYQTKNDIGKIEIIDSKGIKYIFGKSNDHIEYTLPFYPQMTSPVVRRTITETPNAWYLSSVVDANDQEVYRFEYERGDKTMHFYRLHGFTTSSCAEYTSEGIVVTGGSNSTYEHSYDGFIIFPIYLKKIHTISGNEITFVSSTLTTKPYTYNEYPLKMLGREATLTSITSQAQYFGLNNNKFNASFEHFTPFTEQVQYGSPNIYGNTYLETTYQKRIKHLVDQLEWRRLDEIQIRNYHQDNIYNINFNYSLIGQNRRLSLQYLTEIGKNNTTRDLYSFEYYDFDDLPYALSKQVDKWGYYSGRDFLVNLVERTIPSTIPPDNHFDGHEPSRRSDGLYLKKGLLKKVTYPTKGSSTYSYEANKASKKVNEGRNLIPYDQSLDVGGVRIKKIEKNNGTSIEDVINYEYEGGVLLFEPTFFDPNYEGPYSTSSYVFNINSLFPLSNNSRSHIGYSKVIEKHQNNSMSEYFFSDYNMYPDDYEGSVTIQHSIFNKTNDKSFLRGKLLSVNKKNSQGNLVEKIDYEYLNVDETQPNKFVRALEYSNPVCQNITEGFGNAYKVYYMDYDIVKKNVTQFFPDTNSNMLITEEYKYNDNFLISEIKTKNNNKENQLNFRYISDIPKPWPQPTHNGPYQRVLQVMHNYRDMIDYPLETIKRVDGKVVSSKLYNYNFFNNDQIKVSNIKHLKKSTSTLFTEAHFPNNSNVAPFEIDDEYEDYMTCNKYDVNGNPIELEFSNGIPVLYIWGYKHQYLLAKIENATYDEVNNWLTIEENVNISFLQELSDNDNNESSEQTLKIWLNKLREIVYQYNQNTRVTTYTYDPLIGMTSATNPRGEATFYEYDDFNRLKYVKDSQQKIIKRHQYNLKN